MSGERIFPTICKKYTLFTDKETGNFVNKLLGINSPHSKIIGEIMSIEYNPRPSPKYFVMRYVAILVEVTTLRSVIERVVERSLAGFLR